MNTSKIVHELTIVVDNKGDIRTGMISKRIVHKREMILHSINLV